MYAPKQVAFIVAFCLGGLAPIDNLETDPNYRIPTKIILEQYTYEQSANNTATIGIALAAGSDNEAYSVLDNPPRILWWNNDFKISSEIDGSSGFSVISDLCFTDLSNILAVDPLRGEIMRFSRRLDKLPSVKFNSSPNVRFEPRSICRNREGTLYAINQADNDLWKIDGNGMLSSLNGGKHKGGWLDTPRKIRWNYASSMLVILDGRKLIICDSFGSYQKSFPIVTPNPRGLAVFGKEAWIVGNGISCLDLFTGETMFQIPVSSIPLSNGNSSIATTTRTFIDISLQSEDVLLLLEEDGAKIHRFKIVRQTDG